MDIAIVIPAQDTNQYHKNGDLAPFGDTTLLEWKISQCKEFIKNSQIYIASSSNKIKAITDKEQVGFIHRRDNISNEQMISETILNIKEKDIMWLNVTSPFINATIYKNMYDQYQKENLPSLISAKKIQEYIFFNDKKLNFSDAFISRKDIKPAFVVTNGCYILNKNSLLENLTLIPSDATLYEVDSFISTEIKDMTDYTIARDMISLYFKRDIDA